MDEDTKGRRRVATTTPTSLTAVWLASVEGRGGMETTEGNRLQRAPFEERAGMVRWGASNERRKGLVRVKLHAMARATKPDWGEPAEAER